MVFSKFNSMIFLWAFALLLNSNPLGVFAQTMFYPILTKPTQKARNIQRDAFIKFAKNEEAKRTPPQEAHINDVERKGLDISKEKEEDDDGSDNMDEIQGAVFKNRIRNFLGSIDNMASSYGSYTFYH